MIIFTVATVIGLASGKPAESVTSTTGSSIVFSAATTNNLGFLTNSDTIYTQIGRAHV